MADEIYVVLRTVETKTARWDPELDQERRERGGKIKAVLEDAGGEQVLSLGSYTDKGIRFIYRFPSFAAWDQFRKGIFGGPDDLQINKFWDFEIDICFKRE